MIATYAALSFLDGLLLWLLIGARGRWFVKMLMTVLVLGFNTLVLYNSNDGSGWPTRNDIPNGASFLSCVVNEPTPTDAGSIDFWVIVQQQKSRFGYSSSPGTPKAFQAPYSRQLHILCLQAQKAAKQGQPVGIMKNKGKAKRTVQSGNSTSGRYHLNHFPPPQLPRKGN